MTLTRPSAVKKASATAMKRYKEARVARQAEKIQQEQKKEAAKLSIDKDSEQNAPRQSAKRKADDDENAGQRPKKIAKSDERQREALKPKERHITAKPMPLFKQMLNMGRKTKPATKQMGPVMAAHAPVASRKRTETEERQPEAVKPKERQINAEPAAREAPRPKERHIQGKPMPLFFQRFCMGRKPSPSTKQMGPVVAAPETVASGKQTESEERQPEAVKPKERQSSAKTGAQEAPGLKERHINAKPAAREAPKPKERHIQGKPAAREAPRPKERHIQGKPMPMLFQTYCMGRKPNPSTKQMGPVVAAPDPVASRKRKATAGDDESAQKKPKLANDVSGLDGIEPTLAKPEIPKPGLPRQILAQTSAPQLRAPKSIPAGTAIKVDDVKAKAKAKDGGEESAVSGSTKRKAEESSPRPAKKRKGSDGLDTRAGRVH